MTRDDLNKNYDIIYDHRNLIVQLKQLVIEVHGSRNDSTIYKTYYYYDESGNRIRKKIYNDENDSLLKDIVYSRDVSGKELAIYENENIKQWNIWGTDNAGFITGEGDKRYYLKDHLGSIRAVIDEGGSLVSAQDYDAWGYQLQDRSYNSEESIYKFTSKERDEENKYDYFGARYYDSRIGRWGSIDKLQDIYKSFTPYNYTLNNPSTLIDKLGLDVELPKDKTQRDYAMNIIKKGLPFELEKFINYKEINGKYLIDQELINTAPIMSGSEEFNALMDLVNNKEVVGINLVETGNKIERISSYNEKDYFIFNENQGGLTIMSGNIPNTNTFPNAPRSLTGKTEIFVNSSFNEKTQVKNMAHELYGHAYPYTHGERWEHYYLGDYFDQKVFKIMENAIKNFNNR